MKKILLLMCLFSSYLGTIAQGNLVFGTSPVSEARKNLKNKSGNYTLTFDAGVFKIVGLTNTFDISFGDAATITSRQLTIVGGTGVTVTGGTQDLSANRTWTVSLPQSIATTATPTFAGLTGGSISNTEIGYLDNLTGNIQTQLGTKANLASPALTGTPTAPTATFGANNTQIATTAFVAAADALKAPITNPTFLGEVESKTIKMPGTEVLGENNIIKITNTGPGAISNFSIDRYTGTGTFLNNVMTIRNSNVGFGTTGPAYGVDINSTFRVTGQTILPSNTTIGTITNTELSYIDGVTSAIQTQLDTKLSSSVAATTYAALGTNNTFTGVNTAAGFSSNSLNPYYTLKQNTTNNEWRMRGNFGNGVASTAWNLYNQTTSKYAITAHDDGNVMIGSNAYYAETRLGVFGGGGSHGANIDVRGTTGAFTDQSTIELEGADYDTQNRSTYLQYMGLSTTGTYGGFSKSNMARLIMNGNTNIIGTQYTKPLVFLINDSEVSRFDSTGNFQVNEQIKSKKYNITGSGYVANGSDVALGAGNSSDFVTYNPSGRILFSTNGSVRMAITNAGNVGIGTLAPTSKFEVSGTGAMRYVDANQADGKYMRSNTTGIASWATISHSAISGLSTNYAQLASTNAFTGSNTFQNVVSFKGTETFGDNTTIKVGNTGNGTIAEFSIKRYNTAGTLVSENLTIRSDLVGIMKTLPQYALDVNGTTQATQFKIAAMNTAPASATATGTVGEVRITATHIYVCTAANTWVRTALATW